MSGPSWMYYVSLHLLLSYCVHAFHSQHGTTTTATGLRLNLATTSSPSSHGTVPAKAGEKRKVGIIIVDHGSRLAASNSRLLQLVDTLRGKYEADSSSSAGEDVVAIEAAHMELASPSIQSAFHNCVSKGATHVICHPYFLSSAGRHMQEDIPRLLQESQSQWPSVSFQLTPCIGDYQEAMLQIMTHSIAQTMEQTPQS